MLASPLAPPRTPYTRIRWNAALPSRALLTAARPTTRREIPKRTKVLRISHPPVLRAGEHGHPTPNGDFLLHYARHGLPDHLNPGKFLKIRESPGVDSGPSPEHGWRLAR